jgi:preprotein translocase subunit SecE
LVGFAEGEPHPRKKVGWQMLSQTVAGRAKRKMMEKVKTYILDSIEEIRTKVTWPKFNELQSSAILVLVASLIFAIIIMLVDISFMNGLSWFYNQAPK